MYHFVRAIYRSYRGREAAMQSLTKELSQELNLLDQEEILIKMLHRLDISDEFGLNDNLKNIDEKIKEIVNELIHEEKIHKKIHLVDKLADLEDEIEVDKTNASMVRFSSNLKKTYQGRSLLTMREAFWAKNSIDNQILGRSRLK